MAQKRVTPLFDPSIPALRADGTLPPYKGSFVKLAKDSHALAPYAITLPELVARLGTSARRRTLLRGLLRYRHDLAALDLRWAMQWIAGSITDAPRAPGHEPNDIDVATFALVPDAWFGPEGFREEVVAPHAHVLDPEACRRAYGCDAYLSPVNHVVPALHAAHSFFALYSHTKDDRWKGFFQVELTEANPEEDRRAAELLNELDERAEPPRPGD
jgi:hypothetical protein